MVGSARKLCDGEGRVSCHCQNRSHAQSLPPKAAMRYLLSTSGSFALLVGRGAWAVANVDGLLEHTLEGCELTQNTGVDNVAHDVEFFEVILASSEDNNKDGGNSSKQRGRS